MMKNIFKLETVLIPEQVEMVDYPTKPLGIWNPAAYVKDDKLVIIPRLHFDTKFYASSIGLCQSLEFNKLSEYNMGAKVIKVRMLKYPTAHIEVHGVEDPRITEDGEILLTVGINRDIHGSQTIMHDFNGKKVTSAKPFLYKGSILHTGRDAVIINDYVLFFRPEVNPLNTYKAHYEATEDYTVITECFNEPVLPPRKMVKTGFSTNAVKISNNEYLVGYHGVFEDKYEYREGFVLMNDEGNLLGKTPLFLQTEGILRYASGRPFTLFGCGLVLRKERLYFVGGIGDTWTAIYSAELSDVLGEVK